MDGWMFYFEFICILFFFIDLFGGVCEFVGRLNFFFCFLRTRFYFYFYNFFIFFIF